MVTLACCLLYVRHTMATIFFSCPVRLCLRAWGRSWYKGAMNDLNLRTATHDISLCLAPNGKRWMWATMNRETRNLSGMFVSGEEASAIRERLESMIASGIAWHL